MSPSIQLLKKWSDFGNVNAMIKLVKYYQKKEDYVNVKKYYLMAIGKNDDNALYAFDPYYKYVENDYKQNNDEELHKLIFGSNYKMTKDYKRIFPEKCSRCLDKYIEPSKKINCIHKDICNECTKNREECMKCGTKYG